ncbi:DUF3541 domain-containing protein [Legionella fallonii]|uniref:DUF3541 domain-containing protein n=1 Tax=Legionella fallonii LLAP-10 TaxID=1212491 RepID=A0A098G3T7_9GAMM|nr:DUF3541 domain-containing protein [Legionella fallonii]CEG57142.1 conserved protein of unknown function [Legionella fallonii LLAP-10]
MRYLIISLCLFHSVCYATIGDRILKNYQSKFFTLPVVKQEHFAIRMYAITGNAEYLNPIINYLYLMSERYKYLNENLKNNAVIENENKRLLTVNELDTDKTKERIRKSLKYPRIAYYLNLLILINKIHSYHLEDSPLFPNTSRVINFLKTKENDFKNYILDEENIKIYGAQLINYVYYLYNLGIVDLREPYTNQFKNVFPDSEDERLTDLEYSAKIYGMTHFIISASRFYQGRLRSDTFEWITTYLKNHISEIIARTENDVIAEVGVSLLLVKDSDPATINTIKAYLNTVYSRTYRMIPDKKNSFDLDKGEHRNILTIMLFNWPEKLTKNPDALLQTMIDKSFLLNEEGTKLTYGLRVPY